MKHDPLGEYDLKVGMKILGVNERDNSIKFKGTIIGILFDDTFTNGHVYIKRDDGIEGGGIHLDNYGTTWIMSYNHTENMWIDGNSYLSLQQINWRERLSK